MNAPLLDLLILSIVEHEESYGYQISQQLKQISGMQDSALYPILKRLSDQQWVSTYDQPFQGRNRKYYKLTAAGKEQQHYLLQEWEQFTETIDTMINQSQKTPEREENNVE